MSQSDNTADIVRELVEFYGDGPLCPSADQWRLVVESEHDGKILMLNYFKFNEEAEDPYQPGIVMAGLEAMAKYGEYSQAGVARYGGSMVFSALMAGNVIGTGEEDWDGFAAVEYPSPQAFIDLFSDPDYRKGHRYREAGLARHRIQMLFPA